MNLSDPNGHAPKKLFASLFGRAGDDVYDIASSSLTPRNMRLAGDVHPVTKVPFNQRGYPDFSEHLYRGLDSNGVSIAADVNIGSLTGRHSLDVQLANARAGLLSTPDGFTWHHNEQKGRMQLVNSAIHGATGHTGGAAIHQRALAIAVALAADIGDASAADWVDFAGDMLVPLVLTAGPAGSNSDVPVGEGKLFATYSEWEAFNNRFDQLSALRQLEIDEIE